jgi:hypothetical protein
MFDIQAFYAAAVDGKRVDHGAFKEYLKRFKNVILWGAGDLGNLIGGKFIELGLHITSYWDTRAEKFKEIHGIQVKYPYKDQNEKDTTVVVFCIINNVTRTMLMNELKEHGYTNILDGVYLYQALICPFDSESGVISRECINSKSCNTTFCQRLQSIIRDQFSPEISPKGGKRIHIGTITFVVNQKCTLGCKYCTSYMNRYPAAKRINFSTERILDDIDRVMDALDSTGTITVMGGEPFLHPDIGKIVQRLSEKKNFATLGIATSGTCRIKPEQLIGMEDPRVFVSFANYTESLTEGQCRMYDENVDMVRRSGINFRTYPPSPQWRVTSTLYNLGDSIETMSKKRHSCLFPSCIQLKNGKLHLCDLANAIYSLGIADYPVDYIDITQTTSRDDFREKLRALIDCDYFLTCGHCELSLGLTEKAAEQGYVDFMAPLSKESGGLTQCDASGGVPPAGESLRGNNERCK